MTEDEQEAKSARYVLPRVMRLASGRFALFTGRDLDQLQIVDGATLLSIIPGYDDVAGAQTPVRRQPERKIRSINLADLGL